MAKNRNKGFYERGKKVDFSRSELNKDVTCYEETTGGGAEGQEIPVWRAYVDENNGETTVLFLSYNVDTNIADGDSGRIIGVEFLYYGGTFVMPQEEYDTSSDGEEERVADKSIAPVKHRILHQMVLERFLLENDDLVTGNYMSGSLYDRLFNKEIGSGDIKLQDLVKSDELSGWPPRGG